LLSSLLFGMPFTAITLFAMREARRLRGNSSAGLIGYATGSYGADQILGPLGTAAALGIGAALFTHVWWHSQGAKRRSEAQKTLNS
jgi:hypothetical protein